MGSPMGFVSGCAYSRSVSREVRRASHLHSVKSARRSPRVSNAATRASSSTLTRSTSTESGACSLLTEAADVLRPQYRQIDDLIQCNVRRVLDAFRKHRVGSHHFAGVNGYGHGDLGRDVLDGVFAELFGCEAALVRVQFFSGTHAIASALYGVLRPGDELLSAAGAPYDTLEEVIGLRGEEKGSLRDLNVSYSQVELKPNGQPDLDAIVAAVRANTRMVLIQRSCGYSWRASLSVREVGDIIAAVKSVRSDIVCFVDNCYGEFVEALEPTHVGADLVAGSLIKNPGGTLASAGGYVAGKAELVAAAANRLSAPGVGGGATFERNKELFQGLFLAPQMVGEALKGARLVAEVMTRLGYECKPSASAPRTDIIQAVRLGSRERVLAFCRCVQRLSPVGSYIEPVAGVTPGYGDECVFADGTFVDGSTLELSADGPLREPFVVFAQGGTHWTHWAIVLENVVRHVGPATDA